MAWRVATCRQRVEVSYCSVHRLGAGGYGLAGSHLSPDGGGLILRCPPLGSGWLRLGVATCRQTVEVFYCAVHRFGADGYGLAGSHLSPEGGGLILRCPPLGSGWLRLANVDATYAEPKQRIHSQKSLSSSFIPNSIK